MKSFMTLKPGSNQAIKNGCTCISHNSDDYLIDSRCPVHWMLHQKIIIEKIYNHTKKQGQEHTHILYGLIAICLFVFFLQIVTK